MLQKRIKSALFIDYENVGRFCPAHNIANWLAWIEDGQFDEGRKRKLVEKRVYWNPSSQKHEKEFQHHGFTVVLCEKFVQLKNGADIRIALDMMESITGKIRPDEYILFAKDTDYVPVLQRLEIKSKRSAILADEDETRVFAIYDLHADITIPVRVFREAPAYARRRPLLEALEALKGFARRRLARPEGRPPVGPAPTAPAQQPRLRPPPSGDDAIAAAVQRTIRVASLKPNLFTAGDAIERELRKIQGFTTKGPNAYCGTGSYKALMKEVASRTPRILVSDAYAGGTNVRYVPEEDE